MYTKFIWAALGTLAILQDVNGKRSKKKHIKNDSDESTPQPNVVSYSTFGFNDVGSYNGFVPSAPDYNNYLISNNQDSSTRLYALAFPSSLDSTDLGSYYDPQSDVASFSINSDGYQTNIKHQQPVSVNYLTSTNHDISADQSKDVETSDTNDSDNYNQNLPSYGTKLNSRNKGKNYDNLNLTEYNIFGSVSSAINGNTAIEDTGKQEYPKMHPGRNGDEKLFKKTPYLESSSLNFPKVIDFTNLKKYYPTSVDSKFIESMQKPIHLTNFDQSDSEKVSSPYDSKDYNTNFKLEQSYNSNFNFKDEKVDNKETSEIFRNQDNTNNYSNNKSKKNKVRQDYKDKVKIKQWHFGHDNNESKKPGETMKGYDYSTNYSNTRFTYDYGLPNRPFNSSIDEIVPAGSNLDFVNYKFPEKDLSNFKINNIKSPYDSDSDNAFSSYNKNKFKIPEEYLNSFRNLYTTVPTTTSHWGNLFKTSDLSSYTSYAKKPTFKDDINDEIVHIPKRPSNLKYGNYVDNKPNDWGFANSYKSYKPTKNKELYDWTNDFNTRFKSEEDLLGLRNHDTSHALNVPSFKPSYGNIDEDFDYKKLVNKWKESYLKSRYRDSAREYESFASEPKPVHVPLSKPYSIEVPHPILVPVPQPFPVKVPIPKPVAVPVIRELTVPVEKPVPYPVIKKVPYPIEKLVPVPVEKQVPVPVVKPYPVHIPQIRPVFHHTKPHEERETDPDDDDYLPRPDNWRPSNKHPKNSRNRPRHTYKRPSRAPYHDRSKKRAPSRRPITYPEQRHRRPYSSEIHPPQKYRNDFDDYDNDDDFEMYCRRTGKC